MLAEVIVEPSSLDRAASGAIPGGLHFELATRGFQTLSGMTSLLSLWPGGFASLYDA